MGGRGVVAPGFAGDEFLGLAGRHAKVKNQILARERVDGIFEVFNPAEKFSALVDRGAGHLVSQIRGYVAVDENNFAVREGRFDRWFGFEAVAGIKQGGEAGIDGIERAEISVEEPSDHAAEPGVVLREAGSENGVARGGQRVLEEFCLRVLSASIDSFDGDE